MSTVGARGGVGRRTAMLGCASIVTVAALSLSACGGGTSAAPPSTSTSATSSPTSTSAATTSTAGTPTSSASAPSPASGSTTATATASASAASVPYPQTSCTSVVHIGDSTSDGLVGGSFLSNPAWRVDAQYKDVGVKNVTTDISGARAIIEHWNNQPNSLDAIEKFEKQNYQGCYVMAIGNNDVANIAAGGPGPISMRIDLMMQHAGSNPVMWLTSRTLRTSGPYTDANFPALSSALIAACQKYPNLRVFDWRGEVQPSWYQPADRIHYTSHGYKERAERIARALANAFPASGASSSCVVHSGLTASQ